MEWHLLEPLSVSYHSQCSYFHFESQNGNFDSFLTENRGPGKDLEKTTIKDHKYSFLKSATSHFSKACLI